jgi:hypothetical protein
VDDGDDWVVHMLPTGSATTRPQAVRERIGTWRACMSEEYARVVRAT